MAVGVDRHADQPPGQRRAPTRAHGEEAGVGAAEADGHAEALGGAAGDVGAELGGGAEHAEGQRVGGDDGDAAPLLGGGQHVGGVPQPARAAGVLHEHAADRAVGQAAAPRSATTIGMSSGSARVRTTSMVWGGSRRR